MEQKFLCNCLSNRTLLQCMYSNLKQIYSVITSQKSFIQIDDITYNDQVSNLRVIDIKAYVTGESRL